MDDPSICESNIREIFKENDFIRDNNKSKCDFYSDFFQTRLWVKFLEMKRIPEQMYHWINMKIFDESILKKGNDYLWTFNKADTPFLDEKKKKVEFKCLFDPPPAYASPEDLEDKYYSLRDGQNSLIKHYISTDKSLIGNGFFLYYIFPCYVESLLPNNTNFATTSFAPDLSKNYILKDKSLNNLKFTNRTKHFLNTVV